MADHFISIADYSREWIDEIFDMTEEIKTKLKNGETFHPLAGKTLAMVFQKPSARTRISFETGMYQLGGHALYLGPQDIGLGKREATKDLAQLFSRYNDIVMARLFGHSDMEELAKYSTVPVINGLTDYNHPCQIMTDMYTVKEHLGRITDLKLVYFGDGNNIVNSFLNFAAKVPFHFVVSCPEGYEPDKKTLEEAKNAGLSKIEVVSDPYTAIKDADVVYTDVWASMGQEAEMEERKKVFKTYQVNMELFSKAKPGCKFMHCLPAHRGDEVTDEVVDSPASIVFDEAENRMHVQKAVMVKLMS
ncbi:ornithine carbamoyltransferase [candidate division KSB1 bacterium]